MTPSVHPPPPDPEQLARERRWLAQVAAGGTERSAAMEALFKAYQRRFKSRLGRFGVPHDQIQDATQEIWTAVLTKAHEFKPDQTPSAWLHGFVEIELLRFWSRRRKANERWQSDDDEAVAEQIEQAMVALSPPTPEDDLVFAAFRRCVQERFGWFKREHPEGAWLLYLRHVEDYTLEQLAQCHRSSVAATSQFLYEARHRFRPLLQKCKGLRAA